MFYEGNYTDSMQFATFDESWLNYVCAPMEASSFTADPATTIELPVTITNQEAQAISGSVSVGTSTLFSAAPQQVGNLAAGASTTIKVPLTISSTAYGKQTLQLQFTSSNGKTSQATVSAQISGKETTGITVSGQRTDTSRDLATNPYVVGE